MIPTHKNLATQLLRRLNQRRIDLGMTYSALAKRSGLGMRTVQRVLAGDERAANLHTVLAIASALEARRLVEGEDINSVRFRQAKRKAVRLVQMAQGTSALEAQAVDEKEKDAARQRTVRDLLASRGSVIWDD